MEPKVSKTSVAGPTELDAVAWVRSLRDAMYEKTKATSREDFAAYVTCTAAAVNGAGTRTNSAHGTG